MVGLGNPTLLHCCLFVTSLLARSWFSSCMRLRLEVRQLHACSVSTCLLLMTLLSTGMALRWLSRPPRHAGVSDIFLCIGILSSESRMLLHFLCMAVLRAVSGVCPWV